MVKVDLKGRRGWRGEEKKKKKKKLSPPTQPLSISRIASPERPGSYSTNAAVSACRVWGKELGAYDKMKFL